MLAVEGNAPTKDGGVYCTVGGETFLDVLRQSAEKAKTGGRLGHLRLERVRAGGAAEPDRRQAGTPAHLASGVDQRAGVPADCGGDDGPSDLRSDLRPAAGTGPLPAAQDVLRTADPRQMLPAAVLRCRAVRRALGRRRGAQGLVPLQDGLPRPEHVQLLSHHEVERRRVVPDRVRARLHRVQRGEFLGQRPALPAAGDGGTAGDRIDAGLNREDVGGGNGGGRCGASRFVPGAQGRARRRKRNRGLPWRQPDELWSIRLRGSRGT